MEARRFDAIAKMLARRRYSRRVALASGGGGLVAAVAAVASGGRIAAQDDATPIVATAVAEGDKPVSHLFVQSFQGGALAPKPGAADTYTLTLTEGLGQTVYFSDRPERQFGAVPTGRFLQNFPFGADNPPNAALVLEAGPGDNDVVVMELTSPAYDEATRTATYEATLLSDYEKLGVTFQEQPKTAATLHPQFGAASLFIDDCPDTTIFCFRPDEWLACLPTGSVGHVGTCWSYWTLSCNLCSGSPGDYCTESVADCADGECVAKTTEEYEDQCTSHEG
ncbi:MAG TPA: hypothetical protein VH482_22030 [Thermomicrobiales bacterium]|jgi:hypothetical protein